MSLSDFFKKHKLISKIENMNIYKVWLRENGIPFEEKSFGLSFRHQGGMFLLFDNSEDFQYLHLAMPCIYEGNSSERVRLLEICNKINYDKKVVKACVMEDSDVWLSTEILIDNTPDVNDFFDRLLQMLHMTRMEFMMRHQQAQ